MIRLLAKALPGLHIPFSPEEFARAHPAWADDLSVLAPWAPSGGNYRRPLDSSAPPVITIAGRVSSVMALARDPELETVPGEWDSLIAFSQWSGRGRLGREWSSPGGNISAAIRLPDPGAEWKSLISLLLGDLICGYLNETGMKTSVKWPNDILIGNCKAGGILIEEKNRVLIAGIGLNINHAPSPEKHMERPGLFPPCRIRKDTGELIRPLSLWRGLAGYVRKNYCARLTGSSPELFADEFSRRMAFAGNEAAVSDHTGGKYRGILLGAARDGALRLLEKNGEERRFLNAEIMPLP